MMRFIFFLCAFALACKQEPCKVLVKIKKGQAGWCFLIYDDKRTPLKGNYIELDTNNVAFIGKEKDMDVCDKVILDSDGHDISYTGAKMPLKTSFYKNIDVFCFYVLSEKEKSFPEDYWTESNPEKRKIHRRLRETINKKKAFYYH